MDFLNYKKDALFIQSAFTKGDCCGLLSTYHDIIILQFYFKKRVNSGLKTGEKGVKTGYHFSFPENRLI